MPGKPQSLYDETPQTTKLRKDQERAITEICRTNPNHPEIVIESVRQFIQKCSAKNVVEHVEFDADRTNLIIHTMSGPNMLGSRYYFRLVREPRLEAPTLSA
jgi:hypothetical protein